MMPEGRGRFARVALTLGFLGLLVMPAAAQDTSPEVRPSRPWTQGTTHAANEVVGARSGLDFAFLPPGPIVPGEEPTLPEVTVSGGPVAGLVQVVELSATAPPVGDLPPGPVAVRVRLLPPSPIAPARLEVQIVDATAITLLGSSGQPLALCVTPPGQ